MAIWRATGPAMAVEARRARAVKETMVAVCVCGFGGLVLGIRYEGVRRECV